MRIPTAGAIALILIIPVSPADESTATAETGLVVARTESCAAMVFERICLGETTESLTERYKPRSSREHDGETQFLYRENDGAIFVTIRNNKVVFIRKLIYRATWEGYDRIVAAFEAKYGPGQDKSEFPDYAKDARERESALRAGSGYRMHSWSREGWTAELAWRKVGGSDREISLAYSYRE